MSYQDLSETERARVREQFYNPETTDERRVELLRLMQTSADDLKMGRQCPRCKHYPYFAPHDEALLEGHVYSDAGMEELKITGYCEFCFDLITKEPDEETRGDDWKQQAIAEDLGALAESMGPGTVVRQLSDEEARALFTDDKGEPLPPL